MSNIRINFDCDTYGFEKNRSTAVNVYATFMVKGEERNFKPVWGMAGGQINKYSLELEVLQTALWSIGKEFEDIDLETKRGLTIKVNTDYQLRALKSIETWANNGYMSVDGQPLKNLAILKRLHTAVSRLHSMIHGDFEFVTND